MRKYITLQLIIYFALLQTGFAQEFNLQQQYNQAMTNAKQAFEAKQFSEAIMFYREAMQIKPEALLPKYKIEDIRTIYIAEELNEPVKPIAQNEPSRNKGKSNKEIEEEKAAAIETAKVEATRKMNEDADKVEAELRIFTVDVVDISEDIDEINDSNEINEIPRTLQVPLQNVDAKNKTEVKSEQSASIDKPEMNLSKREVPVMVSQSQSAVEIEEQAESVKVEEKKDPIKVQQVKVNPKPIPTKPSEMSSVEKEQWIEQEQKRLAATYPNKKTIEEIDKPGKHITRVIMNIDNKVTTYLKVRHDWGATFFFIDDLGSELKSINQQYFNTMTNLKTYGY